MGDMKKESSHPKHSPQLSFGKKVLFVSVGIVATIAVLIMGTKIYFQTTAVNKAEMKASHKNVTVSIKQTDQSRQDQSGEKKSGYAAIVSSLNQSEKEKSSNEDCDYSLVVVSLDDASLENEQTHIEAMKEKVKQAAWNAGVTKIELVAEPEAGQDMQSMQLYYQMSPKNMLGRLLRALVKAGLKTGTAPDKIAPAC